MGMAALDKSKEYIQEERGLGDMEDEVGVIGHVMNGAYANDARVFVVYRLFRALLTIAVVCCAGAACSY